VIYVSMQHQTVPVVPGSSVYRLPPSSAARLLNPPVVAYAVFLPLPCDRLGGMFRGYISAKLNYNNTLNVGT